MWKIIKKPGSLSGEDITQGQFKFKSKIIIGHVRLASCGDTIHENTHPFNLENWVFAHNGTLNKFKNLLLGKWEPQGDTDSEYAFCYLFAKLKTNSSDIKDIIENGARDIKKFGIFNFILSDGKTLYAYGHDSLYYVQRKSPFGFAALQEDREKVHLSSIKAPDEKAVIVTTEPLTSNENWIQISGLEIFRNGNLMK